MFYDSVTFRLRAGIAVAGTIGALIGGGLSSVPFVIGWVVGMLFPIDMLLNIRSHVVGDEGPPL